MSQLSQLQMRLVCDKLTRLCYIYICLTCSLVTEPEKGKGKEEVEDENISRISEPTDSDESGSDNR